MKTIGIIGSRRRNSPEDYKKVCEAFLLVYQKGDFIVSGGCPRGGDRFAEDIAKKYGVHIIIHHAQWNKYGRSAGFIRNTFIARDANLLIACVADNRTGGTEDTIRKFLKGKSETSLILV